MEVTDFSAILVQLTCEVLRVQKENTLKADSADLDRFLGEVKSLQGKYNIHH